MITEEIIDSQDRVSKILQYFIETNSSFTITTDNGIKITCRPKSYDGSRIELKDVEVVTQNAKLEECVGREGEVETVYGSNTARFDVIFVEPSVVKSPYRIIIHPRRKYSRVKVKGNPLVSDMYCIVSMKVIDPSIKDSSLQQKIDAILKTVESNLKRSENYDFAKVMLFDGTEKGVVYQLVKKYKKPFVVMDTSNIKLKEDFVLTYEDYIKFLAQAGKSYSEISQQIDEIRGFYISNKIISEAIVPIFFDEEVIGIMRVVSKRTRLSAGNVKRLQSISQTASLKLETEGSFEVITKDPQEIIDISLGGMRVIILDDIMTKYVRLGKRLFVQMYFPDKSAIKTLAAVMNIYGKPMENMVDIGVKFSSNMDWKDKTKLENFINSIIELERKGEHRKLLKS